MTAADLPGLSDHDLLCRAVREFRPGEVVFAGAGDFLQEPELPAEEPERFGVWFLNPQGAVTPGLPNQGWNYQWNPVDLPPGGAYLGAVDVAAIMHSGRVDAAVLMLHHEDQLSPSGRLRYTDCEWGGLPKPEHPGYGPSILSARRLIGCCTTDYLLPSFSPGREGSAQLDLLLCHYGALRPRDGRMELVEIAPGLSADFVRQRTGGRVAIAPNLQEMDLSPAPPLAWPDKVYGSAAAALYDVPDGAVVNVDGFAGPGGMAHYLLTGLRDNGPKGLTIISNTAGIARVVNFGTPEGLKPIDHSILVENGQMAQAIASYPVSPSASRPSAFEEALNRGEATLEVVPQGTLAERLRAGGAGVGAFYTPTAAGTLLGAGKESREIDGRECVLEYGLMADFCIIRGHKADTLGNVVYKGTSRNFNPVMATAARVTVVEVDEIVAPGELGPEEIVTPGLFVDRIVQRPAGFSQYL